MSLGCFRIGFKGRSVGLNRHPLFLLYFDIQAAYKEIVTDPSIASRQQQKRSGKNQSPDHCQGKKPTERFQQRERGSKVSEKRTDGFDEASREINFRISGEHCHRDNWQIKLIEN
jgi:hypothetical protein